MIEKSKFAACVLIAVAAVLGTSLPAQELEEGADVSDASVTTKTRTQLLNELNLKTAQLVLDNADERHERYRREYENARELFKQGIYSKKELDEALSAYESAQQDFRAAQIQLEKTRLGFLANATHITVMEAKKYYNVDGRRMLDLTLKNTSDLTQAESALGGGWESLEQIQSLLDIESVVVSLVDGSVSIGKPYEKIIPLLGYRGETTLTFTLLRDAEDVGVRLKYLDEEVTERIFLEKESLQKIPTMVAAQFSQEGELGTKITYDLELEMLVTTDTNFSLAVTNLPAQIKHTFVDADRGARVTRVRFTEEVSKQALRLELSIPEKLEGCEVDEPVNFQAWVLETGDLENLSALMRDARQGEIKEEDLREINGGRTDLVLIPKGTGRLEVQMNNLFAEIKPGEEVQMKASLANIGTLTLSNVTAELSPPLGWVAEVFPESVPGLAPGEKQDVTIRLVPGPDCMVGDYEALVEATGQRGSDIVRALDKRLRLRVSADTSITVTLVLVIGLVVLMAAIVVIGVRLSRR